jgi:hypothetical protein
VSGQQPSLLLSPKQCFARTPRFSARGAGLCQPYLTMYRSDILLLLTANT